MIQSELLDNLQIYSFQLDEDDMKEISKLETGIRKIIPVAKLTNGEVVVRDQESKLFPFMFEDFDKKSTVSICSSWILKSPQWSRAVVPRLSSPNKKTK